MWEPKLRTPGIASSSARAQVRACAATASSEVPGRAIQCIRKSFSLKLGQELLAQRVKPTPATQQRASAATASTSRGPRDDARDQRA